VIVWYLKLALWPCPLVVDYFDWPVARSLGAVWLPALIVGMLLALTGWAAWRKPKLGFLGAWFFLILAPTTILPMATEVAAERRMYLPSIAVVTLVVLAMNKALERWPRIRVGLAAAVVLLFCGLTLCRNHDYGSEMRIWADAATKRPRNTRALINWGTVLAKQGRTDEAMTRYRAALAVDPQYVPAYFNLGVTFAGQGSNAAAIAQFRRALTLSSNSVLVLHNLGLVLAQTGETGEATNYLAKAVSLAPDDAQLHNDFGALLARHGNLEEALQQFRMAAWLSPDDASARQNLRRALFQLGRTNDTARLRPTPPH
jgi:Flp pilus assembly protein TadD